MHLYPLPTIILLAAALLYQATAHPTPSTTILALRAIDNNNADKPRAIIFFETSQKTSVTKTVIIGTTQNPVILNPTSAEIVEVQGGKANAGNAETEGKVVCEASKNFSSDAAGRFEGDEGVKGQKVDFGKDVRVVSRVFCDFA